MKAGGESILWMSGRRELHSRGAEWEKAVLPVVPWQAGGTVRQMEEEEGGGGDEKKIG